MSGTISGLQLRAIFALMKKVGMPQDDRAMLAMQYSGGRTDRLSELNRPEANSIIAALQAASGGPTKQPPTQAVRRMRSKVLHLATTAGLLPQVAPGQRLSLDQYAHFNAWMLQYSYLHKYLPKYSEAELPKLVSQLEKIAAWRENKDYDQLIKALLESLQIQTGHTVPDKTFEP